MTVYVEINKIEALDDIVMPHDIIVTKGTEGELMTTTGENITVIEVIFPVRRDNSFYMGRVQTSLTTDIYEKIKIIKN